MTVNQVIKALQQMEGDMGVAILHENCANHLVIRKIEVGCMTDSNSVYTKDEDIAGQEGRNWDGHVSEIVCIFADDCSE